MSDTPAAQSGDALTYLLADAYALLSKLGGVPDADYHVVTRLAAALSAPAPAGAEPVLYVSPEQLAMHQDGGPEHGRYLPARKTPVGKFTQALYTRPQPAAKGSDTERLDYVIKHGAAFCAGDGLWFVLVQPNVKGTGKTPREAIDAALAAHGADSAKGE